MGSLVAAMASYLDAKAHNGLWLLRIEDLDFDRNVAGADQRIIAALYRCGMRWDGEVTWQSQRLSQYQAALDTLAPHTFTCACSRKEIADSRLRPNIDTGAVLVYPGTCRTGHAPDKTARAQRLRVPDEKQAVIEFHDRLLGKQAQNLSTEVGDFILRRADGFWAYQLAVVVDDAAQGISDVVRGEDLLDSTARQIYLQGLLGLTTPRYCHVNVVRNAQGEKLSKQTGALAFDLNLQSDLDLIKYALLPAAHHLDLRLNAHPRHLDEFWTNAIAAWQAFV